MSVEVAEGAGASLSVLVELPAPVPVPVPVPAGCELPIVVVGELLSVVNKTDNLAAMLLSLPLRILLQPHCQSNSQRYDQRNYDGGAESDPFPTPSSDALTPLLTHMTKLLCIFVAPHTNAEVAPVTTLFLTALPRRVAKSAACQSRYNTVLLRAFVSMLYRVYV